MKLGGPGRRTAYARRPRPLLLEAIAQCKHRDNRTGCSEQDDYRVNDCHSCHLLWNAPPLQRGVSAFRPLTRPGHRRPVNPWQVRGSNPYTADAVAPVALPVVSLWSCERSVPVRYWFPLGFPGGDEITKPCAAHCSQVMRRALLRLTPAHRHHNAPRRVLLQHVSPGVSRPSEGATPREATRPAPRTAWSALHLAPIARDTRPTDHAHTTPRTTRPAHAHTRTRTHAHPQHAPHTHTRARTHHAHPATHARAHASTRGPPPPPTPASPARKRSASRGARGSGGFMR